MSRRVIPAIALHFKCRAVTNPGYCRDETQIRFNVPDDKVAWSVKFNDYDPLDYTTPGVLKGPVWADPEFRITDDVLQFNAIDGRIDRRSHHGKYEIDGEGLPLNPAGRTGMKGRGTLGKWGPNHAADPIVTRWKRDVDNKVIKHPDTGRPVLQFVAIVRRDNGDWAIPGGMVDAGEHISITLKREFSEEAMNTLELPNAQCDHIQKNVDALFQHGIEIYRGYVDDPRNTDNAWMETVAYNFHDEDGSSVGSFKLNAGDDAVGVKWTDLSAKLQLYASHKDFVEKVARLHNSHW